MSRRYPESAGHSGPRDLLGALLDFEALPGRYPITLREPRALFERSREVLLLASGRPVEGLALAPRDAAGVQRAACFFVRMAMLRPGADHYTLLGLEPGFQNAALRDHYRMLIRLTHPDFAASSGAWPAGAATRINLANDVLGSVVKKAEYDSVLASAARPVGPVNRLAAVLPLPDRRERPAIWGWAAAAAGSMGALVFVLVQWQGGNVADFHPDRVGQDAGAQLKLAAATDNSSTSSAGKTIVSSKDPKGKTPSSPAEPTAIESLDHLAKEAQSAQLAQAARAAQAAKDSQTAKAAQAARAAQEAKAAEAARVAVAIKVAREAQEAQAAQAAQLAQAAQASQLAKDIQTARAAQVARAAQEAQTAEAARAAQAIKLAKEAQSAKLAQAAQEAQTAEAARVAQAAKVAKDAQAAKLAQAAHAVQTAQAAKEAQAAKLMLTARAAQDARQAATLAQAARAAKLAQTTKEAQATRVALTTPAPQEVQLAQPVVALALGKPLTGPAPPPPAIEPAARLSLADAQPALNQLIQAMQAGRGDELLRSLDRPVRQSAGAADLVNAYNLLVGGSRAVRLGPVKLRGRPSADQLAVDGVVQLVLQDQGQPAPVRELHLRALFMQRDGHVVMTELSTGGARP